MEAVDKPSWCSRTIVSSISAFSITTHSGFVFRYGRVDPLFPLRCAWIRAIGFLGRGCAYRGIVFKIEPVTSEAGLRFPDYQGAVICLKRLEVRTLLRQGEKIPEGPRRDFDCGDRAVRADVRDMARGRPASSTQVEDG